MKKFLILILPLYLFASYEIVVATLRYQKGVKKIEKEFPKYKTNLYKKGDMHIVALGDFDNKKEALDALKDIKKLYPSAFIREIKKRADVKEKREDGFLVQIAVLSKKENIDKIKNKFKDFNIIHKTSKNFYKVYALFDTKDKALNGLEKIKKVFPTAFLVGEKISSKKILKNLPKVSKKSYTIFIGAFRDGLDRVLVDLINEENYLKKKAGLNYLYIVNIPSKEEAQKKLKNLLDKYPDAKIVSSINITPKIDIKNEIKEENKSVESVMDREIKSFKESNESKEKILKSKTKEPIDNQKSIFNSKTILKIRKNYVDFGNE